MTQPGDPNTQLANDDLSQGFQTQKKSRRRQQPRSERIGTDAQSGLASNPLDSRHSSGCQVAQHTAAAAIEALARQEKDLKSLWSNWTEQLSHPSSAQNIGMHERVVTFETVLRSSQAVQLSVMSSLRASHTSSDTAALKAMLLSFASPPLGTTYITNLCSAIQSLASVTAPDVQEAARKAVSAAIQLGMVPVVGSEASSETSSVHRDSSAAFSRLPQSVTATRKTVLHAIRAHRQSEHQLSTATSTGQFDPRAACVTRLVSLTNQQHSARNGTSSKQQSTPPDMSALAAEGSSDLELRMESLAAKEASLLHDLLCVRQQQQLLVVQQTKAKLAKGGKKQKEQLNGTSSKSRPVLHPTSCDAGAIGALQLQEALQAISLSAPLGSTGLESTSTDSRAAFEAHSAAAFNLLRAGVDYMEKVEVKLSQTTERLRRAKKQGAELAAMGLGASTGATNAKSQMVLQSTINEILDTCTEVSTACSFASASLERHNHGRDPRGEANGVMGDDSLQTVENAAHLLSSVMQKKQELQSIAAGK